MIAAYPSYLWISYGVVMLILVFNLLKPYIQKRKHASTPQA